MKKANKNTPAEQEPPKMPLTRRNYVLLAIGFAVILLGFVLMAGGGSDSPDAAAAQLACRTVFNDATL